MYVSLSFIPDYPKLHVSLYTLNTANVWPIVTLWEAHPPVTPPSVLLLLVLCISALLHPGKHTWAVYSYTTCKLMLPYRCELFIDSRVTASSNFVSSDLFFPSFHTHRCLKENPLGESRGKEEERIALSCSLLLTGHSSHCSNSPIKPSGYFLISLDDVNTFWLGEHLQFSMRSNALVAPAKSLLCCIKPPQ